MRHHKQSLPKENKSMTEKGKQYMKKKRKFSMHPRDFIIFLTKIMYGPLFSSSFDVIWIIAILDMAAYLHMQQIIFVTK